MKKYFLLVIVLCTIINIYFALPIIMAYIAENNELGWQSKTGPIGDTFGGLLSPLIGLVSIYFIYETFKAQREQLEDQKKANNATVALLYLEEVRSLIANLEAELQLLTYTSLGLYQKYLGLDALNEFVERFQPDYNTMSMSPQDKMVLDKINDVLNRSIFIAEQISVISRDVEPQYVNFIISRFKTMLKLIIPNSEVAYEKIRHLLSNANESISQSPFYKINTRTMYGYYKTYDQAVVALAAAGFLRRTVMDNLSFEEFYNELIDYNELSKIEVKFSYKVS